jgi:thioredoxin 2
MSDVALIPCPVCGANNRVLRTKLAEGVAPLCGRCKTPLHRDDKPLTTTDRTFAQDVDGSRLPVLVDAWAPWCAPCRMIAPVMDELAKELSGRLRVAKLNVDENPALASRFNLRSIPTLLIMKDGREVDRIVGVQPKANIVRRLAPFLD